MLFKLWETTLGLLREVGEVPQQQLAAVIAEACGASPTTVVNLLAAAHRAGLIRKRYATEGRPRRRRAYVRLPEPQETR